MTETIVLPTPEELVKRIRACREELAALKRLHRMATAAQAARNASHRRSNLTRKKRGGDK
jgi:hypothetical protein